MTELKVYDITCEEWREYEYGGVVYRITNPQQLYTYSGSTTHRVVDTEGVVHCLPSPGYCGCVLRWKNKDVSKPVMF